MEWVHVNELECVWSLGNAAQSSCALLKVSNAKKKLQREDEEIADTSSVATLAVHPFLCPTIAIRGDGSFQVKALEGCGVINRITLQIDLSME
ncbi:hypothetical protein KIN20_018016 [Parelaphostrongylus tenuis]|uniref:Uncharacterized protein n=1 Tax=Parelaphostrongylus tenuis TaxID=148309 RepID=A0AAD5QP43_PARTN|nr:hypothetical protein KIN20_018016 [Parelaphostrongylus tenuis]